MKAKIPQHVHESYLRHRRERNWQIIFPIVLTFILLIALIGVIWSATFYNNGDVARWAAVSTIVIVIPIMIGMLIVLALLAGLVYLLAKLLNITPMYTGIVQDYVYLAESYIKRGTELIVKQVLEIQGVIASIHEFFRKLNPK